MTETAEATDISALLAQCLVGDEQAIELLVRQYETGLFRFIFSVVNDPMEANDLAQETFIAALKSLSSYQERSSFKAWLYTIALNLSRSHLRKQRSLARLKDTLKVFFRLEQKQSLPEEVVIQTEKERALWAALSKLDDKHRIPLILRYFNDLPVAEIAEIMETNEGTIHSRLHFAREQLRIELERLAGE